MTRPSAWGGSGAFAALLLGLSFGAVACRDLSRFDSGADHYQGKVVAAEFVRAGMPTETELCLTLDIEHIDETPGTLTTNDGRFQRTPLRPFRPLAHDPLSTFSFGTGRTKNYLFLARSSDQNAPMDMFVVVSLMDGGGVEARFLKPGPFTNVPDAGPSDGVFAVFVLGRKSGVCPFGPT